MVRRGYAALTAALVACAAMAWGAHAQDDLEAQSCDAEPRLAAQGEAAFQGVGEIRRLSWPSEQSPISDQQLREATSRWRGSPLDIATVRCAGLAMEAVFRDAGYPYTRVAAPPQRVDGGLVRYEVTEGWVERVTPSGENARARLHAYRRLRSLESSEAGPGPIALRDLERASAQLDEAPGLNASLAITRGGEGNPGAIRVVARAEPEPRDLIVNVNNLGAEALGRSGVSALFSTPGRAPLGDKFTASFYSTFDIDEQRAARLTYQRGLTASGLVAAAEIAFGEAEPKDEVRVLGAVADSTSARFMLTHPAFLGRETRVRVGVGLDGADQSGALFLGQVRLSEDKTRNLFARVEGEAALGCARFTSSPDGACWRLAGDIEARQGLEALGASDEGDDDLARPFADPQATVVRAGLEIETPRGPGGLRARLQLAGQAADKALMAFEELNLGNYTLVRGYDPGALAGDSGVAGSFELMAPQVQVKGFGVEAFGFYDAARVWNEDPLAPDGRDIGSFGGGLRIGADRRVRLEATWARPLHAPLGLGDSQPSSRVLFSLTASIPSLFDWAA